jgi:hypothetical protein
MKKLLETFKISQKSTQQNPELKEEIKVCWHLILFVLSFFLFILTPFERATFRNSPSFHIFIRKNEIIFFDLKI